MGWGNEPHEGFAARELEDGQVLTEATAASFHKINRYRAVCSCGWRGGDYPPDDEGIDAAYEDWATSHWGPMVAPDPAGMLLLGRDGGGRRHFLAGRPVHCGTPLELLVVGKQWVPVRYEWDFVNGPTAYLAVGGPWEGVDGHPPQVSFGIPEEATLRWPLDR